MRGAASAPATADTILRTRDIQAALDRCAGTGRAVELTTSGGSNAFLSGPLIIGRHEVLLVSQTWWDLAAAAASGALARPGALTSGAAGTAPAN